MRDQALAHLHKFVPSPVLEVLTDQERAYLVQVFQKFNGYPSLECL